jgi:lysophospholipase L1-like esterase
VKNVNLHQLMREWREGRTIRILWLGDSLTAGTSTFAGPRDWFKFLASELGLPTRYVGPLTTQNGLLATLDARDYAHAGVGGETTAQIAARGVTAIDTYDPDIVIVNGGGNDASGDTLSVLTANWVTLLNALRGAKEGVPIVVVTRHPANNAGTLSISSFMVAQTYGPVDAAKDFDNVVVVPLIPTLGNDWTAEWYPSGDSTHYNNLGYARTAGAILKAMLGGFWQEIPYKVKGQDNYTSVAADIDYPFGAYIRATGGTYNLVFADGSTRTVEVGSAHPASLAANTVLEVPVVRIKTSGTTIGTNTLTALPLRFGAIC